MIFNSLDELFDTATAVRQEIYAVAEALPSEVGTRKPALEIWSVAETLDHLGRTEERLVSRMKQHIAEAEAELSSQPSDAAEVPSVFKPVSLEKQAERASREKFTAPQPVAARPDVTVAQALERIKATRADLLSLRPQIERLDLSEQRFPHPVFGNLNVYEWIGFISLHEQRHLDQIVVKISGFEAAVQE